jgi:dipeptidyl aminopeptidase/acylaminoacyl peptidase
MEGPVTAPYGSWKSPISADLVVSAGLGLGSISLNGEDVYWVELRPQEGGRMVLVRRKPGGEGQDVTPPPYNVRTRVHEYGGRSYAVDKEGSVYFSNFSDQRLYVIPPGGQPRPFSPDLPLRYADPIIDDLNRRLICVQEDHTDSDQEAVNSLVSLSLEDAGDQITLASGNDFYATPRLSPSGKTLAWLTWNHPNMPWDGTELWIGDLREDGSLTNARQVAGGEEESIFQPEWSPDGVLYFVSDRTGWWNPYRQKDGGIEQLIDMPAEFGLPQWVFGMTTYGFASTRRLIVIYKQEGKDHLASFDLETRRLEDFEIPYDEISGLQVDSRRAVFVGASPVEPAAIVQLDLDSGQTQTLRRSSEAQVDEGYLSLPQAIEFPTEGGLTAYGFYYPPHNKDFVAPEGELSPLLVKSHGGPTGSASTRFSLGIQFWTSRGIAVLNVNYGGSAGFGRAYRQRLNGLWGVVDVDDCVNGAKYLAERGEVDPDRLAIDGGSAGGYTTLCALTFRDTFKAGASYFGVGDLEPFVKDTHKFESRYLDRLIGPYPERRDLYYQRSPINFLERLSCPMILFQGLEDKIVPPNQAEMMFAAVREKGLPVAYLPFEGEQHGFRKAENIKRSLEAELYFYSRVFGFDLADEIEPVEIENLPA